MIKLIGISGKKQSGKNTVANLLAKHLSGKIVEYAFADSLKLEVAQACKVSVAEIEKHKPIYRQLLQSWGSWRREHNGKDYFVEQGWKKLLRDRPNYAIITDVRHVNEAEYIKQSGGVLIRVVRNNVDVNDTHESETALDAYKDWDDLIINTGDLGHLKVEVESTAKKLKL